MGRGKSTQAAKPAEPEATANPEEAQSGAVGTEVEQEGLARDGQMAESGITETEEVPELSKEEQQAAIAGPMGGPDQYPYVDRTQIPVHERNSTMDSRTEASQAELNPAFTAKEDDGGPVTAEGEGIGTEPNALEQQADAAENQGGEELREKVEEQQAEAQEQQMDVDAVNEAAEERAPEDVDASTGQKE